LYGTFDFLEQNVGVRWYAPDATVIPTHATITVKPQQTTQTPGFAMRDTNAGVVRKSAEWDAHIRLNGTDVPDDPAFGGNYPLFNGDENFYHLVPPSTYFKTHPEYFSLVDGVRTTKGGKAWGDAQLCLTNPDVFNVVTDALSAQVTNNPKLVALGLSPNDAENGRCQDALCLASDARYGAPSGTLLNFVNREASAVQSRFPNRKLWVETLAYQYNEPPPREGTIVPASNVLVCLCPIFACDAHPMATDPDSAKSRTALLGWSKVAKGHLQIWHYATNFANFLQPLPDFDELGPDMLFYQQHGVSGVFVESDYKNVDGELEPMRTWVLAHLLWNPNQPVWPLVKDFCEGYYGPAGDDIYAYVKLLHSTFADPKQHLHIFDGPHSAYFSKPLLAQADKLFEHASSLVSADTAAEYGKRVGRMHLGLEYVELMQAKPGPKAPDADQTAWHTRATDYFARVGQYDIKYVSEEKLLADWDKPGDGE
jgi:hypothetical protein